jgi:hypothetical protein
MFNQNLFDKTVSAIFCNPPYSEFIPWMIKIISEANTNTIYFVVPLRWKASLEVHEAIASRNASTVSLGEYNFTKADRVAQVDVEVLKIRMKSTSSEFSEKTVNPQVDAFTLWFNDNFPINISETEKTIAQGLSEISQSLRDELSTELVAETDLISNLTNFYQRDLDKLLDTYKAIAKVSPDILEALNINAKGVKSALELKYTGLKDLYWQLLFEKFAKITDRLTHTSRQEVLNKLTSNTHVDFTAENIHAVLTWLIKNADSYFDNQLVETYEKMIAKTNVIQYKSNQKTFRDDQWKYNKAPYDLDCYSLDYRIVLSDFGGLHTGYGSGINGLSSTGAKFIDDLCAIASNICFDTYGQKRSKDFDWLLSNKNTFQFRNIATGKLETLFTVRAFKNRNLHFQFNQLFICRLNVEMGRIKSWLKSPQQAADELDIDLLLATQCFNSNLRLSNVSNLPLIGMNI